MASDQNTDDDLVTVPDLAGKTVEVADPKLSEIELTPAWHDSNGNAIPDPQPDWVVIDHIPSPGQRVQRGSVVVVNVTT